MSFMGGKNQYSVFLKTSLRILEMNCKRFKKNGTPYFHRVLLIPQFYLSGPSKAIFYPQLSTSYVPLLLAAVTTFFSLLWYSLIGNLCIFIRRLEIIDQLSYSRDKRELDKHEKGYKSSFLGLCCKLKLLQKCGYSSEFWRYNRINQITKIQSNYALVLRCLISKVYFNSILFVMA